MNRILEVLKNNKGVIKKAFFVVAGIAAATLVAGALQPTDELEDDNFDDEVVELEMLENAEISEN